MRAIFSPPPVTAAVVRYKNYDTESLSKLANAGCGHESIGHLFRRSDGR